MGKIPQPGLHSGIVCGIGIRNGPAQHHKTQKRIALADGANGVIYSEGTKGSVYIPGFGGDPKALIIKALAQRYCFTDGMDQTAKTGLACIVGDSAAFFVIQVHTEAKYGVKILEKLIKRRCPLAASCVQIASF